MIKKQKTYNMATKKKTTNEDSYKPSLDPSYVKRVLQKVLKEEGLYNSSHAFLLDCCAEALVYMRRISRELRGLNSLTVDKVSREGNSTPVPHPLNAMYVQALETVRRYLSEMLFTPKASTSNTRTRKNIGESNDDRVAAVLDKVNSYAEDDD